MGRVAVIGGGASGMMAAITAAGLGAEVTVYEKNDRVGKKILATGNGKCNFSNRDFGEQHYYGDWEKLKSCFERFSVENAVDFFRKAGMLVKDKGGYLYPWPEQASAVLDVLRLEMRRNGVGTELCAEAAEIEIAGGDRKGFFVICSDGRKKKYDAVILACGGCAAPKTGSDGNGFALAGKLGHRIVPVVPALVQLRCKDSFLKITAGVRCWARIGLYEEKGGGISKLLQEEEGELQFTDYGISGIPVFQMSRQAAYLVEAGKQAAASIDLLPQMDRQEFEEMCMCRMKNASGRTLEEFLVGLSNKKINQMVIKEAGHKPGDEAGMLGEKKLKELLHFYKELRVHIYAANSFEHAQVTAGGVDLDEVTQELESEKVPGIFFAGEMLDVDGRCGGYNLQWAWTSGFIAGQGAARHCQKCGMKLGKRNGGKKE